jgi:hypothetical protein
VIEEAAQATAATAMTLMTVILTLGAARLRAAMTFVTALAAGVLVMMTSKHVCFRSCFVISK